MSASVGALFCQFLPRLIPSPRKSDRGKADGGKKRKKAKKAKLLLPLRQNPHVTMQSRGYLDVRRNIANKTLLPFSIDVFSARRAYAGIRVLFAKREFKGGLVQE